MSIFSNQSSVEVIAVASVFLTLSISLALRLSPSPILLRALAVICLMLGRLNGFKYEHEAVKCHNSSLILLTKTAEEKKRGSITHTDITFHHDNDTLRSVQALLTLDAGPCCVIIAQTSDPSSNAFIVLHLIRFLFSRFFCRIMRGRGSGVALL